MKQVRFPAKEFEALKSNLFLFNSAIKTLQTRLEIIKDDFQMFKPYNPFEHIESRIKSFESIAEKLKRKGKPLTMRSAIKNLDDIAGMRIICSFANDIQVIAGILKDQNDIILVRESDYVKEPKESGYRSYHMILSVPVYLVDGVKRIKVELQIRTQAMDFWASLEHKVRYKYSGNIPDHLSRELKICADKIDELDKRMYLIHDIMNLIREGD